MGKDRVESAIKARRSLLVCLEAVVSSLAMLSSSAEMDSNGCSRLLMVRISIICNEES